MKESERMKNEYDNLMNDDMAAENDVEAGWFERHGECSVFYTATVVSLIFSLTFGYFGSGIPELGGMKDVLVKAAYYGIWMGALVLFTKKGKRENPDLLGIKEPYPYEVPKTKKMTVKAAVICIASICSIQFISSGCQVLYPSDLAEESTFYPVELVISLVLAPVFEELIFRGFLQKNLRKYGDRTAIIIAAITFGLAHSGVSGMVGASLSGLIFGYLAMSYGLGWSMAAHLLANVPAALEQVFSDTSLNFVIGRKFYFVPIGLVLIDVELLVSMVLVLWLMIRRLFCKKRNSDLLPDDSPRMQVQFSNALKIPALMAAISVITDMLRAVV